MEISAPIQKLRRLARLRAREASIPLHKALDDVASKEGFRSWDQMMASRPLVVAAAAVSLLGSPAVAQDCGEGQRVFSHVGGETCIPMEPRRIVSLHDQGITAAMLELGIRPIASMSRTNSDGETRYRGLEAFDTSGIVPLGSGPYDPESILALDPDLIIVQGDIGSVELPDAIQPVVYLNRFNRPYLEALVDLADVIGLREEGLRRRADFEARINEIQAELGSDLDRTTVSFITWNIENDTFRLAYDTGLYSVLFNSLEIKRLPSAIEWNNQVVDGDGVWMSIEEIQQHDGDVVFLEVFNEWEGSGTLEKMRTHPLLSTLMTVEADQAYELDGPKANGNSWAGSHETLETIAEVLLDDDINRDLIRE